MWDVIPFITTPITLIAFGFVVYYMIQRSKIKQEYSKFNGLTSEDRVKLLPTLEEKYQIKSDDLTKEQRFELINRQFDERSKKRRDQMLWSSGLALLFLTFLSVYLVLNGTSKKAIQEPANTKSDYAEVHIVKLLSPILKSKETDKYVIPIGIYNERNVAKDVRFILYLIKDNRAIKILEKSIIYSLEGKAHHTDSVELSASNLMDPGENIISGTLSCKNCHSKDSIITILSFDRFQSAKSETNTTSLKITNNPIKIRPHLSIRDVDDILGTWDFESVNKFSPLHIAKTGNNNYSLELTSWGIRHEGKGTSSDKRRIQFSVKRISPEGCETDQNWIITSTEKNAIQIIVETLVNPCKQPPGTAAYFVHRTKK
jgi:hypothetical protein